MLQEKAHSFALQDQLKSLKLMEVLFLQVLMLLKLRVVQYQMIKMVFSTS